MSERYASAKRSESLSKVFTERNNWFVYEIPSLNKIGICLEKNYPSRPAEQADDYRWIASIPNAKKVEAMEVENLLQRDRGRLIDGSYKLHSEQTISKMSASHSDKVQTKEHNEAISKGLKGKPKSDSHKKNLSQKGKCLMWITNGSISKRVNKETSIPNGWRRGRTTGNIT